MKSLKEQLADKCKHFNGLMSNTCACGVVYEDVKVEGARPIKIPCFRNSVMAGGSCAKAEFKTPEEVEALTKDLSEKAPKTILACMAVKKKVADTQKLNGTIKCPGCGGELRYTCSKVNGHTRGNCNCGISWIE